jgi:hypothetical protein
LDGAPPAGAGKSRWQIARRPSGIDGCGEPRAVDRLRKYRESIAGAIYNTTA